MTSIGHEFGFVCSEDTIGFNLVLSLLSFIEAFRTGNVAVYDLVIGKTHGYEGLRTLCSCRY